MIYVCHIFQEWKSIFCFLSWMNSIAEYSAKNIYYIPGGQKIMKKFPPIFHFHVLKIALSCIY